MARVQFDSLRSPERRAIVASFDLSGFSDFCNHPDAYALLPKFISALFDTVDGVFLHSHEPEVWQLASEPDKVRAPDFAKYTGDGVVMIWLLPEELERRQQCGTAIVHSMKKLRERLAQIIPRWAVDWQVNSLPHRARFGIATGFVYPLRAKSTSSTEGPIQDYAGYCINLAVRLQNHCPEIGFLIHEPVLPKIEGLVKMIAHGMKGTRSEPVLIFALEMPPLELDYVRSKFSPTGDEPDVRIRAIQPEKYSSEEHALLAQPRFEAHFQRGPMNGATAFMPNRPSEFHPIAEVKDSAGKVIGREVASYKLTSIGPLPSIHS